MLYIHSYLYYSLTFTTALFTIGLIGFFIHRKNVLMTIMSLELMLLAVNLNFLTFSIYLDDIIGQIFVLFILTVAATESAIGLTILSTYYNSMGTIQLDSINSKNY